MFTPKKIWTLEEALEAFPKIKRITEDFYEQTYTISKLLSDNIYPENEMEKMEDKVQELIRIWSFTMQEMEIDVKGIWLVDFDNGEGYYCWKIGEEDLLYEHSYEEGFAGRKLIKRKK